MADYIPDIQSLLPQGPPFIMVDRLLDSDGTVTRTCFVVTADNPLTGDGRLGVAGMIENIAQTAAAGTGWEAEGKGTGTGEGSRKGPRSGAIVSVNRLEIHDLPRVGDELLTETRVTTRVADIIVISGTISCGQSLVAAAEMKILTGV